MGKIKKYIDVIVSKGSNEEMEELQNILEEVLHDLKEYNYEDYKCYKEKLYCLAYGPVISDEMREEIIEKIGEHWTLSETNNVKDQYGYTDIKSNEFNVVMNMAYSDYKDVFNDNLDMYAKFSKAFINDSDAREGKVYYYFETIPKRD